MKLVQVDRRLDLNLRYSGARLQVAVRIGMKQSSCRQRSGTSPRRCVAVASIRAPSAILSAPCERGIERGACCLQLRQIRFGSEAHA